MDDIRIVELYWARNEQAIAETERKYGKYLNSIAYNILYSHEDARECVNDTYHDAWRAMPPHKPSVLSTFLGKITRRLSIDRLRHQNAAKRGGGEYPLALDELGECVSGKDCVENELERRELAGLIDDFLGGLGSTERKVFVRRYWHLDSVQSIALRFGFSESKVKSMLSRIRTRLRLYLTKEGY